jgi:L-ribulose-5-phosphate 4-epimerase
VRKSQAPVRPPSPEDITVLETLKEEICHLNLELPKNGLVAWTSGNVSGRDPGSGLVLIKPSGVRYESLTPQSIVVVDLEGRVVDGSLRPSVDTAAHLYIYRHRPDVGGVVHTHSTFATAFAAAGRPIPACLTAICDEFGGPIPCAGYARVGGEEIGREVVDHIGVSPAILLRNHGVFTVGRTAEAAVKAAVTVEDAARTVFFAMQLGPLDEVAPEEVARAHQRYLERYGQK